MPLYPQKVVLLAIILSLIVLDMIWARQNFPGGTRAFWDLGSPAAWVLGLLLAYTIDFRSWRPLTILLLIVGTVIGVIIRLSPCGGPYGLWGYILLPAVVLLSFANTILTVACITLLSMIASFTNQLKLKISVLTLVTVAFLSFIVVMFVPIIILATHAIAIEPCSL